MATYYILMDATNDDEVQGFHVTFTSEGSVLIIFSRQSCLDEFLDPLGTIATKRGQKIAFASVELDSFEDVVRFLVEAQDTANDDKKLIFVPDDAPIVDSILEYHRTLAQSAN